MRLAKRVKECEELVDRLRTYAKDQGGWHNIDDTCEEAADAIEAQEAKIAKLEKALTLIRYINHGPDRASGEWRCMEAAQIARNALEEISLDECDASSNIAGMQK